MREAELLVLESEDFLVPLRSVAYLRPVPEEPFDCCAHGVPLEVQCALCDEPPFNFTGLKRMGNISFVMNFTPPAKIAPPIKPGDVITMTFPEEYEPRVVRVLVLEDNDYL